LIMTIDANSILQWFQFITAQAAQPLDKVTFSDISKAIQITTIQLAKPAK
jgi:hypothetical protein